MKEKSDEWSLFSSEQKAPYEVGGRKFTAMFEKYRDDLTAFHLRQMDVANDGELKRMLEIIEKKLEGIEKRVLLTYKSHTRKRHQELDPQRPNRMSEEAVIQISRPEQDHPRKRPNRMSEEEMIQIALQISRPEQESCMTDDDPSTSHPQSQEPSDGSGGIACQDTSSSDLSVVPSVGSDIEITRLVLRSASGDQLDCERLPRHFIFDDPLCIDRLLRVIGNYKQPLVKSEVDIKLEPDTELVVKLESEAHDALKVPCVTEADDINKDASEPCNAFPNCFLPRTIFKTRTGYVQVEELQVGDPVLSKLSSDGSVVSVVSVVPHPLDKYAIIELVTRKGSFKVSACHRIPVANTNHQGTEVDLRAAGMLRAGDRVFMGERALPLTKVTRFETRTELYSVAFYPDVPVESFLLPCGMQTHGDVLYSMPSDLGRFSEEELRQAMPAQYDD